MDDFSALTDLFPLCSAVALSCLHKSKTNPPSAGSSLLICLPALRPWRCSPVTSKPSRWQSQVASNTPTDSPLWLLWCSFYYVQWGYFIPLLLLFTKKKAPIRPSVRKAELAVCCLATWAKLRPTLIKTREWPTSSYANLFFWKINWDWLCRNVFSPFNKFISKWYMCIEVSYVDVIPLWLFFFYIHWNSVFHTLMW